MVCVDNTDNLSAVSSLSYLHAMQRSVMGYISALDGAMNLSPNEEENDKIQMLCGKESAISVLIKLCQLQQQLIKLTEEMAKNQPEDESSLPPLSEEDWDMLTQAVASRCHERSKDAENKEMKSRMDETRSSKSVKRKRRWFRIRCERALASTHQNHTSL